MRLARVPNYPFFRLGKHGCARTGHCDEFPASPEALTATQEASLDLAANIAGRKAVRMEGVVVPVVSDGPPELELAAAIAWMTFRGRMLPINRFEYGADTLFQPIVDLLMAPRPELPNAEAGSTSSSLAVGF